MKKERNNLGVATAILFFLLVCNLYVQANGLENARDQKLLLLGKRTLRTHISLTTVTTIVSFSCFNGAINTAACGKRRRKKSIAFIDQRVNDDAALDLSSSLSSAPADEKGIRRREGKLKFMFWSKTISVLTVISTSTDPAVTFSVSYFCSIGNASFFPTCG